MRETEEQRATRRMGRTAALVIAGSGLLAIFAPFLVRAFGLAPRFEILIYLFALAGFAWALIATFQIWRRGQKD